MDLKDWRPSRNLSERYGLYDMAGNMGMGERWYRPDYYAQLTAGGVRDPQEPDSPSIQSSHAKEASTAAAHSCARTSIVHTW
jgi:hypothetical protein